LFWKKILKKKDDRKKLFKAPEDVRKSFRVTPAADGPIKIFLDDKSVSMVNISSGGACFKNNNFKPGTLYPAQFLLPDEVEDICVTIEIISFDDDGLCRSRFHDLSPEHEDQIHQYVLNRQKEILAEEKKRLTL